MSSSSSEIKRMERWMNNNPKILGPGKWDSIHDLSCFISNIDDANKSIYGIKKIIYSIKCECVDHAINYINENPIENSIGEPDEHGYYIGIAKWTWSFHNAVNIRLGKQWMPWDIFEKKYINRESSCAKK